MGAFKKGEPRPPNAGRRKGTPNKATATLRKQLAALDLNLGLEIITALRATTDESVKVKLLELIAKYTAVVPTSDDPDAGKETTPEDTLSTEELTELARLAGRGNG